MYLGNGSDQASLEYSFSYNPPMDLTSAENNLKEVKQVLDQLGVVFFSLFWNLPWCYQRQSLYTLGR